MASSRRRRSGSTRALGYAVVGVGYIAQIAVLPAFRHARRNSKLVALVSDDPRKLRTLAKRYRVPDTYSYEEYDACLANDAVDCVYIALPNNLHCDYTIRAARAGVHVLCEKPMAIDESECQRMIDAARRHRVKLMTAYRLHFDEANLHAVELVRSGRLGEPRLFNSVFTMQVKPGDIRVQAELGGGTLYDIGIYCINAARYLFRAEPTEVTAVSVRNGDQRFKEVDEMTSAILRFPGDRLAAFTSSFGAADVSAYELVGTKGTLRMDPAYEHAEGLAYETTIGGRTRRRSFPRRDQFAPELLYFSDCVLTDRQPEPSGLEGLADVRIIRALYRSAGSGRPIQLRPSIRKRIRPKIKQAHRRPAAHKPSLVNARPPSRG